VKLSVKVNDLFGSDVEDADMIRRAADAGADAIGYWPWYAERLGDVVDTAASEGVDVAYLSGGSPRLTGPEFPLTDPTARDDAVAELARAIDIAADVDSAFLNVIPGRREETRDPAVQHSSIVRTLREVAGHAGRAGVTLLVEPVNTRVDHPGIYLTSSYEGYGIVEAVDSPNVKLLYDVYHQQITEGNLVANVREHVDQIGHVHVGDVPGRHEPGTGEINYPNVLAALAEAGYDGYVGCEFEPTGRPEDAIRTVGELIASL
jgi:hydroxypyruvate isomerase